MFVGHHSAEPDFTRPFCSRRTGSCSWAGASVVAATPAPSPRPCMSPSPTEAAPLPPLSKGGYKTRPSTTADWTRNGHLTRLDQSDALPRRGPADSCGGLVVGLGAAPGGGQRARAGAAAGRKEGAARRKLRPRSSGQRKRRRSCHASCRHPVAASDPEAAALPVLDSEMASCSSHKSSPCPRACASGLPFGAARPSPPAAAA